MKRSSVPLVICLIVGSLLLLSGRVSAFCVGGEVGLNKEQGGDIYKEGSAVPDNQNGAMPWNGSEYVVNNTWAHTYFFDVPTGQRCVAHDPLTVNSSGTYWGFQVTRNVYGYSIPALGGGGVYLYQAVEYVIVQPDGMKVIIRSRGSGNGLNQAYFNIYIQDPDSGGTTAMRGDPVWFNYDGMTPEQAANQTSETFGRAGNLPTSDPPERSQYWLDVNNGSDMGGYSYHFHTGAIASLTRNLGSSFPTAFDILFYDPQSNTVKELRFNPEVLSETFQQAAVPAISPWGGAVFALLLAASMLVRIRRYRRAA